MKPTSISAEALFEEHRPAMRWEWIDFERGILQLQDSKTGRKPVYLSPAALEVLAAIARPGSNPHVIAGRKIGRHFVGLSKVWARIRRAAALEPTMLPNGKVEQSSHSRSEA